MGIPHLLTHLHPYAVDTPLKGTRIVIDGPSLAYHIWHLCSRSQDAQPSHALLVKTSIAWMEALERQGATIQEVFFDAFLPPAKRPVRMDRLLKMSMKLQHLQTANPVACPERHVLESDGTDVDFRRAADRRREPVHTPAFLVPAVIEGLKASRFLARVRLVPGEADAYCAQHLLEYGGCVITSDSDLLVHDLGSGSVILFWNIELLLSPSPDILVKDPALSTPRFTPHEIVKRLGIPPSYGGMRRFGFELTADPHASLSKILESCLKPVKVPKAFAEFAKPYDPLAKWALAESMLFSTLDGESLDPRISEIVLQSQSYASLYLKATSSKIRREPEAPQIFLPLLLDCPSRASAWDFSGAIRQLAYSLLHHAYPDDWPCVREFRRIQSFSNKGRQVDLLSGSEADDAAESLTQALDHIAVAFEDDAAFFLAVTLHQDVAFSELEEKEATTLASIKSFFIGGSGSTARGVDWTIVHLIAQIQAAYYSLRLLFQMIKVVVSTQAVQPSSPKVLKRLYDHLGRLPRLTEYPSMSSTSELLHRLKKDGGMSKMADMLGIKITELIPASQAKGRKRRKTTEKEAEAVAPKSKRVSTNPFDILGDE